MLLKYINAKVINIVARIQENTSMSRLAALFDNTKIECVNGSL